MGKKGKNICSHTGCNRRAFQIISGKWYCEVHANLEKKQYIEVINGARHTDVDQAGRNKSQ